MVKLPKNKQLVLFDGVCNLCNSSIIFIIKNDVNNVFYFAPLQSDTGKLITKQFGINTSKTDSILLYNTNAVYSKSVAALKIASKLKFPYNLLVVFRVIPPFISNVVYDFIARNRYKWFGKKESCMVPTPQLSAKFLK